MLIFLKHNKFLALLGFIIFFIMFLQGPWLQPDSPGYISGDVSRSFLYPLFLKTITFFIPENYTIVMVIQFFVGFSTIFYTLYKLTNWFGLNMLMRFSIFVILFLPYAGHTKIGNTILTEPICYPLFMLFFLDIFEGVWKKNSKAFYRSVFFAVLLTCTRKQFSFVFVGVYFLLLMEFLYLKKTSLLKILVPFFAFVLCVFSEYLYVYKLTNHFSPMPSAVQFISAPLFIAKKENLEKLHNEDQKNFLKAALQERDRLQVGLHDKYTEDDFMFPVYMKFEVVHDFFRFKVLPIALAQTHIPLMQQDEFVKKLSTTLIKLNFNDYLRVYRGSFVHGLGGYYPLAILCIFFGLGFFLTLYFFHPVGIFVMLASVLQLVNYGVVAVIQPILRRYVFYTDTFYLISVFLLVYCFYQLLCKKPS